MRGRPRQDADVAARMSALAAALTSGGDQLDSDAVGRARDVLERTGQRLQLGAGHTVVALVGATGSGKSSLFNALAGMEIAEVGARRPMTRVPTACIWGEGNTDPLLDWLGVPDHRRVRRESVLDADRQAPLHGLVLLDLPDHDSTEVSHRLEVDRLVELVDLLIWVVDPQKYADDALHAGYLQRLVGHDGVMMVVLNQIDRLGPDEADTCRRDLRRLLDGDGLDSVRVLALSAWRGDGVDELRGLLAASVQKRTAVMERAAADLQAAADDLAKGLGAGEPGPGQVPGTDELVRELASAVGVPAVVEAVAAEYRRRGSARTEWPVLRWLRALNPDALGRLGITVADDDLRMIATSLMPAAAPSQRPHVRLAVDMFLGRVVDPLPLPWATAVRTAVTAPGDDLVTAVDSAVSRVDLGLSAPGWWRGVGLLHIAFGLALLAGSGWLFLIGAVQLAGRLPPEVPDAMGVPLPVLLFLGGLGAGAVTAAVSAWLVSVGARRRAAAAANRLYAAVHGIAEARIITRVQAVLDRHRVTREALAAVDLPPPTPALSATSTQEFAIPGGQFGREGTQDGGNGPDEPGEGVPDGAPPAVRQDAARDEAPAIAPSS